MKENLPLSRKYRPESFDDMFGNIDEIESLKQTVQEGKVTTFLLYGDRGCGKTTSARIIAKEKGIKAGIKEYNISNTTGIDAARGIIDDCRYMGLDGNCIILNEIQRASVGFQNAILEILEEPPKGTYFILCTTNPEKLLDPVKSRCSKFRFSPLSLVMGRKFIKNILTQENQELEKELITGIVKKTEGIPREILVLLDKVLKIKPEKRAKIIENYIGGEVTEEIRTLCQMLLKKNLWKSIAKVLKHIKGEPENIRRAILAYAGAVLLNSGNIQAAVIIETFQENFYDSGKAGLYFACFSCVN